MFFVNYLSHIGLVKRAEVIHPTSQEVAHLEAVFVVHEHCRTEIITCYENLRHDTKALPNKDCRSNKGITDCRPIIGIRPLRNSNHITGLPALLVFRIDIRGVL